MIQRATEHDTEVLAGLALLLWDNHDVAELREEFAEILKSEESACFLAYEAGVPVGFAQCQLRHDYVEGTQTSPVGYVEGTETSPVGYLEGIFVRTEFRHRGLAKQLLGACENWTREKGCTEFASDCELGNDASLNFHLSMGFTEVNRIVCFTKTLRDRRAE